MRHDPASSALVIMLRSLKMHGMAQAVDELAQQGAPAFETAIPVAQGGDRRAGGPLHGLPAQGRPLPGLSRSGWLRFFQQRGQRSPGQATAPL